MQNLKHGLLGIMGIWALASLIGVVVALAGNYYFRTQGLWVMSFMFSLIALVCATSPGRKMLFDAWMFTVPVVLLLGGVTIWLYDQRGPFYPHRIRGQQTMEQLAWVSPWATIVLALCFIVLFLVFLAVTFRLASRRG